MYKTFPEAESFLLTEARRRHVFRYDQEESDLWTPWVLPGGFCMASVSLQAHGHELFVTVSVQLFLGQG